MLGKLRTVGGVGRGWVMAGTHSCTRARWPQLYSKWGVFLLSNGLKEYSREEEIKGISAVLLWTVVERWHGRWSAVSFVACVHNFNHGVPHYTTPTVQVVHCDLSKNQRI